METKACGRCKKDKNITEFSRDLRKDGRLQSWCRSCKTERSKEYYRTSVQRRNNVKNTNEKVRARNRDFLVDYLEEHPCVDCGIKDIRVLEFDHISDKKICGVAKMVANGSSIQKIQAEISKCEVRCCNCHRIATAERGSWWTNGAYLNGRESV